MSKAGIHQVRALDSVAMLGGPFLLFVAGVLGPFFTPPALQSVSNLYILTVWSGCLIIGGLSCMWGLWRFSYRPQIIGSILSSAGVGTYGMALAALIPVSIIPMLMLLSYTVTMVTRAWQLKKSDDAGVPGSGAFWSRPVAAGGLGGDTGAGGDSSSLVVSALVEGEDGQELWKPSAEARAAERRSTAASASNRRTAS